MLPLFEYHTFLHHSQTYNFYWKPVRMFEYHTFLHHSQTFCIISDSLIGLSTIHFYIILKQPVPALLLWPRLSTIHFYIILKPCLCIHSFPVVWVPYIFTSFSNSLYQMRMDRLVWVPYIFTSFSNAPTIENIQDLFEYHTFLHHSQTVLCKYKLFLWFEYHTFLHHSQTDIPVQADEDGLSTIHFYIILKRETVNMHRASCLSTIHFYIILKRSGIIAVVDFVWVPYIFTSFSNCWRRDGKCHEVWVPYIFTSFSNNNPVRINEAFVWVPYIFTSFSNSKTMWVGCLNSLSTIHFYIILKHTRSVMSLHSVWVPYIFTSFSNYWLIGNTMLSVWVPYIFTSFSNGHVMSDEEKKFEYHTFLHHSQTQESSAHLFWCLSTIHFYIILKRGFDTKRQSPCLSTIHFYIILKR